MADKLAGQTSPEGWRDWFILLERAVVVARRAADWRVVNKRWIWERGSARKPCGGMTTMATATNKTDPAVLAAFDTMISGIKGVDRKGATMPYCSINGNMYAMISKADIIGIRLSENDLKAFFLVGGTPFEGVPGFVSKGYVAVPQAMLGDSRALQNWFKLSHAFASKLRPKPTTR